MSGKENMMLTILIRTKFETPQQLENLIQLAEKDSYNYGYKKNYFFVEIVVDNVEREQSRESKRVE